jgi:hypothetical protein
MEIQLIKLFAFNTDGSIDGTFVSGLGFSSGVVIKLNTVGFVRLEVRLQVLIMELM